MSREQGAGSTEQGAVYPIGCEQGCLVFPGIYGCLKCTVSVLGREEGYTVKYTPPPEGVNNQSLQLLYYTVLEDTARYAGLFLAPAEGFGLWLRLFLPFGQK